VGCAVVVPCFKMKFMYRLNRFSNSYIAEALAILKALGLALTKQWSSINICSDFLNLLLKLKTDLSSIFPFIKSNLNSILMELLLKIVKVVYSDNVRFTWCSVHIGIEGNELADICAKSAGLTGTPINNLVSLKEIMCSFKNEYDKLDIDFIDNISKGTGAYYINNFKNINISFIEKLAYKRRDYMTLPRVVTGYVNTNNRLFKKGLLIPLLVIVDLFHKI